MNILPMIKMKYMLIKYDVRAKGHTSVVADWADWANGQVPAMELDGNGEVRQYVGVEDFQKLAQKCKEWIEAGRDERQSIEPVYRSVNLGAGEREYQTDKISLDKKLAVQGGEKYGKY